MNRIAQELDDKLESLDENHAAELARYVRKTIEFYEAKRSESRNRGVANGDTGSSRNEVRGRACATNALLPTKPGALPQADLLWPVGPNRSVPVGVQEFLGLCGLPHFPKTSASP